MSDAFDPYYIWLGIPPENQPPHHYRLLGVTLFESNREVIEAAANRQMAYMQEISSGEEHIDEAQEILGELSRARVCLLNEEKKAAYDAELRASFDALAPAPESTAEQTPAASATPTADDSLIPPQFGLPDDEAGKDVAGESVEAPVGLKKHRSKVASAKNQSTLYLTLVVCVMVLGFGFLIYRINASPSNPSEVTQPGHSKQPRLSKQTFLSQQHWQEDGDGRIVVPLHREYQRLLKRFKDPSDLLQESNLADAIRDAYNKAKNDRKQYQNKIPNHLRDEIVLAKIEILPKEIDAYLRLTDDYKVEEDLWWPKQFSGYPKDYSAFQDKLDPPLSEESLDQIDALAKKMQQQFIDLRDYRHAKQNSEAAKTLGDKLVEADAVEPQKAIAWLALRAEKLTPQERIWKSPEYDEFVTLEAAFTAEMSRETLQRLTTNYKKLKDIEESRSHLEQYAKELGHTLASLPAMPRKAKAFQTLIEQDIVIEKPYAYADDAARQTYDQLSDAFDENAPGTWSESVAGLAAAQTAYNKKLGVLKKNPKIEKATQQCELQWYVLEPDMEQWVRDTFFILDKEDKNTVTAIKWKDELKEKLKKANAVYEYKDEELQSQLQFKGKKFNSSRKRAAALRKAQQGLHNLDRIASGRDQLKSQLQSKKPSELGVGRSQRDDTIYKLLGQVKKVNAEKQKYSTALTKLEADQTVRNKQLQELCDEIEALQAKVNAIEALEFIQEKKAFRKVLQEKPLELDGMLRKFKKDLANRAKKQS